MTISGTSLRSLSFGCVIVAVLALIPSNFDGAEEAVKVDKSGLHSLTGTIERIGLIHTDSRRTASTNLELDIRAASGEEYSLRQYGGITEYVPQILTLHTGDNVIALVQSSDGFGSALVWEIEHDGTTVLSYDQTHQYFEGRVRRISHIRMFAFFLMFLSVVFWVLSKAQGREETQLQSEI